MRKCIIYTGTDSLTIAVTDELITPREAQIIATFAELVRSGRCDLDTGNGGSSRCESWGIDLPDRVSAGDDATAADDDR